MTTAETVTQAEFARRVGVSRNVVYKAIQSERLVPPAVTNDKRLVFDVALDQWRARRDLRADMSKPLSDQASAAENEEAEGDDYRTWKTRSAQLDAERKQLELDRLRDVYRHRDEIERSLVTGGRRIRQALDRLPLIVEELVALNGDVPAMRALMRRKVRELETVIADSLTGHADD